MIFNKFFKTKEEKELTKKQEINEKDFQNCAENLFKFIADDTLTDDDLIGMCKNYPFVDFMKDINGKYQEKSLLHAVIDQNRQVFLKYLLKTGIMPSKKLGDYTPAVYAAFNNRWQCLSVIAEVFEEEKFFAGQINSTNKEKEIDLTGYKKINYTGKYDYSQALYEAVKRKQSSTLIQLLIDRKAIQHNLSTLSEGNNKNYMTHWAVENDDSEVLIILLKDSPGLLLCTLNSEKLAALSFAAKMKRWTCFERGMDAIIELLNQRITKNNKQNNQNDIGKKDEKTNKPFLSFDKQFDTLGSEQGKNVNLIRAFLCDLGKALKYAIESGKIQRVTKIMDAIKKYAGYLKEESKISTIISQNSDIFSSTKPTDEHSLLKLCPLATHTAIAQNDTGILELLLVSDQGYLHAINDYKTNGSKYKKMFPIAFAACLGHWDAVKICLQQQLKLVNKSKTILEKSVANEYYNVLYYAARANKMELITLLAQLLLTHVDDFCFKVDDSKTAIHYALLHENFEILNLLLQLVAHHNKTEHLQTHKYGDDDGLTILEYAKKNKMNLGVEMIEKCIYGGYDFVLRPKGLIVLEKNTIYLTFDANNKRKIVSYSIIMPNGTSAHDVDIGPELLVSKDYDEKSKNLGLSYEDCHKFLKITSGLGYTSHGEFDNIKHDDGDQEDNASFQLNN